MHEFALAKAARDTILQRYRDKKRVKVYIGELNQIDLGIFKDILVSEIEGTGVDVDFDEIPAKMRCNICSTEWLYRDVKLTEEERESIHFIPETIHIFVKCPNCGSNDFSIVEGRGIYVGIDDE